jgi:hypothetical protein
MTEQAQGTSPLGIPGSPEAERRRWWHKLSRTISDLDAEELRLRAQMMGATPVADCALGQRSTVAGVLRAVTLRPREGVPAVLAELYDGSGSVLLIWLGRRRIVGIDPGRVVAADGRINARGDLRVMFNPRYRLLRGSDD